MVKPWFPVDFPLSQSIDDYSKIVIFLFHGDYLMNDDCWKKMLI